MWWLILIKICLIMSIITQRFYLNPPVQSQLFPLIRKTPGVEFKTPPLLFKGVFFFCCTGSLICYDHKSFLPGTILLKCKFVSPSSHQPTGLDNKFSPERFMEMKRPVIFRCCELLFFFLPPIFTVSIQFKKKKKKKYWQAGGLNLLSLAFTRRITVREREKYKQARSRATSTLSWLSWTAAWHL